MPNQTRPRVMIIDDNEITRTLLRMTIQSERFEVVGDAANAALGLERAVRLRPDIICLDVYMPDSDGLDLLAQLRQRLPRAVVLMVTASRDAQIVKDAIGLGIGGFILKPFNAGTVTDALDNALLKLNQLDAQR